MYFGSAKLLKETEPNSIRICWRVLTEAVWVLLVPTKALLVAVPVWTSLVAVSDALDLTMAGSFTAPTVEQIVDLKASRVLPSTNSFRRLEQRFTALQEKGSRPVCEMYFVHSAAVLQSRIVPMLLYKCKFSAG